MYLCRVIAPCSWYRATSRCRERDSQTRVSAGGPALRGRAGSGASSCARQPTATLESRTRGRSRPGAQAAKSPARAQRPHEPSLSHWMLPLLLANSQRHRPAEARDACGAEERGAYTAFRSGGETHPHARSDHQLTRAGPRGTPRPGIIGSTSAPTVVEPPGAGSVRTQVKHHNGPGPVARAAAYAARRRRDRRRSEPALRKRKTRAEAGRAALPIWIEVALAAPWPEPIRFATAKSTSLSREHAAQPSQSAPVAGLGPLLELSVSPRR
jgi:hypothetical protein